MAYYGAKRALWYLMTPMRHTTVMCAAIQYFWMIMSSPTVWQGIIAWKYIVVAERETMDSIVSVRLKNER